MLSETLNLPGDPQSWLPIVFTVLMGMAMLIYVVLDGFDLGIGVLLPLADDEQKEQMIASIGPFWDANETWLVLGVGLLLVAFPPAHGVILGALYLPVSLMLVGLILRGVAFELRAKAAPHLKPRWNRRFFMGSTLASLCQGYMLGLYIMGLEQSLLAHLFALLTAISVTAAYTFIGACWLILKTQARLQQKAVTWARRSLAGVIVALLSVSIASPIVSERIAERWFEFPQLLYLAPLPLLSALLLGLLWRMLRLPQTQIDQRAGLLFACAVGLFVFGFTGMSYSFYPYIVLDQMTIFEAAAAPESLLVILAGTIVVLPFIVAYTALSYTIFRGKSHRLSYD